MSKLITIDQFNVQVKKLVKTMKVANLRVQELAIVAVGYSIEHNDVRPANTLIESLPKGLRKDALVKWLEINGNLAWSTEGKKFLHYKAGAVFDVTKLSALPWYEAKKDPEPESVYDVAEAFDKFMSKVQKLVKEGKVEVANRTLLDELMLASGKWHRTMESGEPVKETEESTGE